MNDLLNKLIKAAVALILWFIALYFVFIVIGLIFFSTNKPPLPDI